MTSLPLAVGLLRIAADATSAERSRARIALALHANEAGYALVETFETSNSGVNEETALRALEELAVRLEADALVYAGPVDLEQVHDVADRVRLMVIGPRLRIAGH